MLNFFPTWAFHFNPMQGIYLVLLVDLLIIKENNFSQAQYGRE